jgi:hypothetical protein
MSGPYDKPKWDPLGSGALGDLLRRELEIGEEASVLNEAYPHRGHIDATLYKKFPDGRIYPVDKTHLDPKTWEPK